MRKIEWSRVSARFPCLCGRPDWCTYSTELGVYCCMRISSPRPAKNGGWLHPLNSTASPLPPRKSERPVVTLNVRQVLEAWGRSSQGSKHPSELAKMLGVSAAALQMLGCVSTNQPRVWAWPMLSGEGHPIGIRMRHENGRKWALEGSRNGLFIPSCEAMQEAIITEGPTCAAAALTMGMFAIGRPSCSGGITDLIIAIKRLKIRRISIIADVDQDKTHENGSTYNPGIDGARKLAELLPVMSRIVTLPCKDLRSFVQAGGDMATFSSIANQLVWNKPK